MTLDPTTAALLWAIVALSFGVEAVAGFGSTLVALSLGAAWFPLDQLLAVLVPVNVLVSGWLARRDWAAVAWPSLRTLVGPVLVGMAAGLAVQHRAGDEGLRALFATFVVGLSAVELTRLRRRHTPQPLAPWPRRGVLLVAGVVHGLFATGGPLVVYALGRELDDRAAFRSTLAVLWICTSAVLLVDLARSGRLGVTELTLSLWVVPPMLLGLLVGDRVHRRVSQGVFRQGVYTLLIAVGLLLLARAVGFTR